MIMASDTEEYNNEQARGLTMELTRWRSNIESKKSKNFKPQGKFLSISIGRADLKFEILDDFIWINDIDTRREPPGTGTFLLRCLDGIANFNRKDILGNLAYDNWNYLRYFYTKNGYSFIFRGEDITDLMLKYGNKLKHLIDPLPRKFYEIDGMRLYLNTKHKYKSEEIYIFKPSPYKMIKTDNKRYPKRVRASSF